MDQIDRANELMTVHNEDAIDRFRRRATTKSKPAPGQHDDCIDCGDAIPPERLSALPEADRCIDCQNGFERAKRLAAR
jgi:DnaK suppressor protein